MATSWALFIGISIQEICAAASWSSPYTFACFYRLDVTELSLAHSVLGVSSHGVIKGLIPLHSVSPQSGVMI